MESYDYNSRKRGWREGRGKAGWILIAVYVLGFAILAYAAYRLIL